MSNKVSFPLVIALLREDGTEIPEETTDRLMDGLKTRRTGSKLILLYPGDDPDLSRLVEACNGEGVKSHAFDSAHATEMIELCSTLVWFAEADHRGKLLAYAKALGRSLCTVSSDGTIDGFESVDAKTLDGNDDWLPSVFRAAGLSGDPDLETIFRKTDALATLAAPVTRRWFKWIVFIQALAVFVPVGWLINRFIGLPAGAVATLTLCTIVVLVSMTWWLRWRGMQKTWARARLVAEVARSMIVRASGSGVIARTDLHGIAALRHLRWFSVPSAETNRQEDWIQRYIKDRIDDQANYFAQKQSAAEVERRLLSRWATLLLDIGLVFAVAGTVIYLSSRVLEWTHMPGGSVIPIVLGVAGLICPLGLLVIQLLRTLTELNRRNARYSQQKRVLKEAKERLQATTSEKVAIQIVEETERQLLAEVFEWYFQVETAEHFFQFRSTTSSASGIKLDPKTRRFPIIGKLGGLFGYAGLFVLRVVLGRILWTAIAGIMVIAWISYQHPENPVSKSDIRSIAVILNADGKTWVPSPERLDNGCIFIVHGLWGGIENYKGEPSTYWTRRMANAITTRLEQNSPDIAVVDWNKAARPSEANQMKSGNAIIDDAMDIAAIRPEAQEVGDYLSFRVAEMILDGTIHRDKPLHLIGHSAGGFVVARVANRLKQLGIAPDRIRVTLLDTPEPDSEITVDLAKDFPGSVDYYTSSRLVRFGPGTNFPGIDLIRIETPPGLNVIQAHNYAHDWYIDTISRQDSKEGFSKSPLNRTSPR